MTKGRSKRTDHRGPSGAVRGESEIGGELSEIASRGGMVKMDAAGRKRLNRLEFRLNALGRSRSRIVQVIRTAQDQNGA